MKLIGQSNLINTLSGLVDSGKLPRLIILVGARGSGKGLICDKIGEMLGVPVVQCSTKAEDVRDIVDQSYKTGTSVLNVFRDIEEMSNAAKNALLKVVEEPPNGAYFAMTTRDINNSALATIRSRGTVFYMDAYTKDDLIEYARSKYADVDIDDVCGVCETPYDIDMLMKFGADEFFEFVDKVVDNIATVSGSNSFKISGKIAFKADDTKKYDLDLFLKIFIQKCSERITEDPFKYADGIRITSKYLQDLAIAGINRQFVFDAWLLDIRRSWMA